MITGGRSSDLLVQDRCQTAGNLETEKPEVNAEGQPRLSH
jgi:hypothetical protein